MSWAKICSVGIRVASPNGGPKTWTIVAPLIQSARFNDLEPFTYLRDILERIVHGRPINWIDEFLP